MQFRTERILDPQQGGLVLATISVPQQWRVNSQVTWTYSDVSHPMRSFVRIESPDGSAWVEFFPIEVFYWLDPITSPTPLGGRTLGMIHAPRIGVQDALRQFVIAPYRSRNPNLQVVSANALDPARLAGAFGNPPSAGEAAMIRLRYTRDGQTAEEDIFGLLGASNRIPYTGPQGTTYENHRVLAYSHALGATNGQLQAMYPLLGYIATSIKIDPGVGSNLNANDCATVSPTTTTTYTLTATNTTGQIQANVTVNVGQVKINSFTADPVTSTAAGNPVTLAWSTQNATSIVLIGAELPAQTLPPNGSLVVRPITNSTYTLTAYGPGGQTVSTTISVFVR
jgi:hypothetical protein